MAEALREKAPEGWLFLSHQEAMSNKSWARQAKCVVNFSFNPLLRTGPYDPAADVDSHLASILREHTGHYIMLSSRMVYGRPVSGFSLKENDPPLPLNAYGRSKLAVEQSLAQILGNDRLTVLRMSNIFGLEAGRRSFAGMAQSGLMKDGRIVYDMSPLVKRDFLAVWRFAEALISIASSPQPGLYNLGAGFGVQTGLIAEWLIEGFGGGELVINKFSHEDQFWLDMTKAHNFYEIAPVKEESLRQDFVYCGHALKTRNEAA